jgi:hypothetical protein
MAPHPANTAPTSGTNKSHFAAWERDMGRRISQRPGGLAHNGGLPLSAGMRSAPLPGQEAALGTRPETRQARGLTPPS